MHRPTIETTEEDNSLLVLLLDTNPLTWGKHSVSNRVENGITSSISLSQVLDHVLIFINAYLMLHHNNLLAIIANNLGKRLILLVKIPKYSRLSFSKFLYPSLQEEGKLHFDDFKSVREHFVKELKDLMNETETLISKSLTV